MGMGAVSGVLCGDLSVVLVQVFGGAVRSSGTSRHNELLEQCRQLKVCVCVPTHPLTVCVCPPTCSLCVCVSTHSLTVCMCVHPPTHCVCVCR